MRLKLLPVLLGLSLLAAGCAPVAEQSTTPAGSDTATASPTPTSTASESITKATPSPMPTIIMPTAEPSPPPAPDSGPVPNPTVTRGPNDVDPADYNSYAVDTVNGGIPLPGVAFRSADGRMICGIFTWGHLSTPAGTATCTVDTYKDIYPQPYPDTGPYVMSVMVSPVTGTSGLYPDWFAQPAREIPVLPEGKSIRYEGTDCTQVGPEVKCTVTSTGKGFVLSPTGYSYF